MLARHGEKQSSPISMPLAETVSAARRTNLEMLFERKRKKPCSPSAADRGSPGRYCPRRLAVKPRLASTVWEKDFKMGCNSTRSNPSVSRAARQQSSQKQARCEKGCSVGDGKRILS